MPSHRCEVLRCHERVEGWVRGWINNLRLRADTKVNEKIVKKWSFMRVTVVRYRCMNALSSCVEGKPPI